MRRKFLYHNKMENWIMKYHIDDCFVVGIFVLALTVSALTCDFTGFAMTQSSSSANNNYPIKLEHIYYYPSKIEGCISGADTSSDCKPLYDKGAFPYEEFPDATLAMILGIVSMVLIVLRCLYWIVILSTTSIAKGLSSEHGLHIFSNNKGSYWKMIYTSEFFQFFLDSGLGLLFSAATTAAITAFLKYKVKYPRPIYSALSIWASIYPEVRHKQKFQASLSFPSGHSSSCASVLGFLIMLMLEDISCLDNQKDSIRTRYLTKLLWLAIWGLLFFSLYVSVSRVKDYWHFASDVVGGFGIGWLCASLSFHITRSYEYRTVFRVMKDFSKKPKYCKVQDEAKEPADEYLMAV